MRVAPDCTWLPAVGIAIESKHKAGLAVSLTNDSSYWKVPTHRGAADADFRVSDCYKGTLEGICGGRTPTSQDHLSWDRISL